MAISGRTSDRLSSLIVSVALGGLVLWAGTTLINRSLDSKFHKDFLLHWEVTVGAFNQQGATWPRFSGGNHVEYMEKLIDTMRKNGIGTPESDGGLPYVYLHDKIGAPEENIFILCFPKEIILYGISAETFTRLDESIDGKAGPESGRFRGRRSREGHTYIGLWRI